MWLLIRRFRIRTSIELLLVLACAQPDAMVDPREVVASIQVSPRDEVLAPGDTLRLRAEAHYASGLIVVDSVPRWQSSNPAVATVDGAGLVTTHDSGTVLVSAFVAGMSDTVTITVVKPVVLEPPPAPPETPPPTPPTDPPPPVEPPAPAEPPGAGVSVLVGAGDIAKCDKKDDELTARLLDGIEGTVFTLGDNAYPDATAAQFEQCYDPTWGRHKQRTRPAIGNHEYRISPDAYFDYFNDGRDSGRAGERGKGYYSYDVGSWHIVVLNSTTNVRTDLSSPQADWLRADLASHPSRCLLAYWHHPFFTSGPHRPAHRMRPLLELLYDAGVEVILTGHSHQYERFASQTLSGGFDPKGARAFVVGTGGATTYDFVTVAPNSEVREANAIGVLKFELSDGRYSWDFVPIPGVKFTDSGSGECH